MWTKQSVDSVGVRVHSRIGMRGIPFASAIALGLIRRAQGCGPQGREHHLKGIAASAATS